MNYYYTRVSTEGQNVSRQIENFKSIGEVTTQNIFIDKIQGNIPFLERPEASRLFDIVTEQPNPKATIVIDSIDRLGRNLIDILNTIELFTQNGINLRSLKEGFQTLVNGKENPMAKIVISVMGSIAEMERNRIKERQAEGIRIAKAHGKYKGRMPGSVESREKFLSKYPLVVKKLKKGLSIREICAITGHSSNTIGKVKKIIYCK